jgi:hypothetical protein
MNVRKTLGPIHAGSTPQPVSRCLKTTLVSGGSLKSPILLFLFGLALAAAAWVTLTGPESGVERSSVTTSAAEIERLLSEMSQRNDRAKVKALRNLRERFQQFHRGIPAFAEDITSITGRAKIVTLLTGRQIESLLNDKGTLDLVQDYVGQSFRKHVLSEKALTVAVREVIAQYQFDLDANLNKFLVQLPFRPPHPKTGTADMTADRQRRRWKTEIRNRTEALVQGMGRESIVAAVVSEAGGQAAGYAATQLVTRLGSSVLAASAAGLIGTGVGAQLVGVLGPLGAVTGPPGAIVGIAVGLTVGIIVDWWSTERFKEKLSDEIKSYLFTLEEEIIAGRKKFPPGMRKPAEGGLRDILRQVNTLRLKAITNTIDDQLREKKSWW